jgi:hydroxymethylpyrimidine pyrophosphatase-like HAD family hydrolase
MRLLALATDYDRTLATDGRVEPETLAALQRFRASGRKLILVTGRELSELKAVFPEHRSFDRIVAENGALLFDPTAGTVTSLGPPADARVIVRLQTLGVAPLSAGRSIIATHASSVAAVRSAIEGLELELVLNRESLMILPKGIDKGTGTQAALSSLGLERGALAAIGDAENDRALLSAAAFAVAVGNALPALKNVADWVTLGEEGSGVVELIDRIINELYDDLAL